MLIVRRRSPNNGIDARLNDWNQGDVVLGTAIPFVYVADYGKPITEGARQAAVADRAEGDSDLGMVAIDVPGVVVVSQSCDLVRSCADQPFVKLAALQQIDPDFLDDVKRGRRPRYAYIPAVAGRLLVANLDAVSTVEKSVIAAVDPQDRIRGCRTDAEVRELAFALSRNVERFAFPDDFTTAMRSIQARILQKHGTVTRDKKGNPTNEGALLTALREIRVACLPSWSATDPTLTFYLIFNSQAEIPADGDEIAEALFKRFKPTGTFKDFTFRLVALSELSAEAYVSSEPLDLEHLSHSLA
jgi:hypothetical protein